MLAFLVIAQTALLVVPGLSTLPIPDDRISPGLVLQSAVLLAAALLAARAMLRWVDHRPAEPSGFRLDRSVPRQLATGLAIGSAAIAVVTLLLAAAGGYRYTPEPGTLGGWLAVSATSLAAFAIPAAAEEALFRGYLLRTLAEGGGAVVAVGLTSLAFAWAHGANPGVGAFAVVNLFLAGVLLAVAVLRTASLWLATALHLGWNWAMAGPLDLPVSGLAGYDVPLYDATPGEPLWLTGGRFGPEGGAAGTIAVMIGLILLLWTTRPGTRLAAAPSNRRIGYGDR